MSSVIEHAIFKDHALPEGLDPAADYLNFINNLDIEFAPIVPMDQDATPMDCTAFGSEEPDINQPRMSEVSDGGNQEATRLHDSGDILHQQDDLHYNRRHAFPHQAPVARMVPPDLAQEIGAQEQANQIVLASQSIQFTDASEGGFNDAMLIYDGNASAATSQPADWRSLLDAGSQNIETIDSEAHLTGTDPFETATFAAGGFYESGDDGDDSSEESHQSLQARHPMSLRANVTQCQTSSGIDFDESGNYDPNAKPRSSRPTSKKRQFSERRRHEESEPRPYIAPTVTEIRQFGHQYCIVLPIRSSKGRKRFSIIHERYGDNWPDDAVELFESVNLQELPSHTYAFRQRKRAEATKDEDYYLRNTPAARGCKHCYETGQHCSMRHPDGSYPCTLCSESYEVCELLVQPKKKHACENCLSQKEPCSYTQDPMGDHGSPCSRCDFKSLTCVARPAYDPLRTRLDANGKPATPPPPMIQCQKDYSREYKTCAPCRRNNRWCSLTDGKKGNEPPCSICRKHGTPCTFEAVPRLLRGGNDNPNRRRRQAHKGDKQPNTVKLIKTAISHPVTFLSSTTTNKDACACHWCLTDNPFYAIHGHGEVREVKVLVWPNGAGYEEMEGGHTIDGCEPSRMCRTCTMERICILQCPDHELRPLAGFTEEINSDIEAREKLPLGLVRELMPHANALPTAPNARAIRSQHKRWCSMCPNPAQFACRARNQPVVDVDNRSADIHSVIKTEHAEVGCGLRLCWVCASLLRSEEICGNDLQKLVKSLGNSAPREYYSRGLRADYDFLNKDGPLWRQVENLKMRYGGQLPDLG